jgi:hypothetical protein
MTKKAIVKTDLFIVEVLGVKSIRYRKLQKRPQNHKSPDDQATQPDRQLAAKY